MHERHEAEPADFFFSLFPFPPLSLLTVMTDIRQRRRRRVVFFSLPFSFSHRQLIPWTEGEHANQASAIATCDRGAVPFLFFPPSFPAVALDIPAHTTITTTRPPAPARRACSNATPFFLFPSSLPTSSTGRARTSDARREPALD